MHICFGIGNTEESSQRQTPTVFPVLFCKPLGVLISEHCLLLSTDQLPVLTQSFCFLHVRAASGSSLPWLHITSVHFDVGSYSSFCIYYFQFSIENILEPGQAADRELLSGIAAMASA